MSYLAYDRMGNSETEPSHARMSELIASLVHDDPEHPDVSLQHEGGWSLSAFGSGLVLFENVEEAGEPRHMKGVPHGVILEMWRLLARGDLKALEERPWQSGNGA